MKRMSFMAQWPPVDALDWFAQTFVIGYAKPSVEGGFMLFVEFFVEKRVLVLNSVFLT